jgi:hypothetical protein
LTIGRLFRPIWGIFKSTLPQSSQPPAIPEENTTFKILVLGLECGAGGAVMPRVGPDPEQASRAIPDQRRAGPARLNAGTAYRPWEMFEMTGLDLALRQRTMVAARDERPVLELWDELMTRPCRYINDLRLSACLEGSLSAEACRKLKASSRGQSRLSQVISTRYLLTGWVDPEQCNEADRVIALTSGERLAEIAMRAGAIFWSTEIARVVLSKHAASLHRQLGESICASAIANRDLAGPVGRLKLVRDLVALVKEDGLRCLSAWCQAQPSGVSRRVRLKLPPAEAFDRTPRSPFVDVGPVIVRRAANWEIQLGYGGISRSS